MKQLTCEMCGSTDMLKEDGVFVCQSCGTKYSVEEAKKLMIEGTVEVQGTVKVDKTKETEALLERAFNFLEDGNFDSAIVYCEKVLDIDPKNARAYLGKLMSDLQVKHQADIKNCYIDFTKNDNYKKAIRYADTTLESTLNAYAEYFNNSVAPILNPLDPFYFKTHQGKNKFIITGVKDKTIEFVEIPNCVVSIGDDTFEDCRNLVSIVIPNGVMHIGNTAFKNCTSLTSITLPDSITSIGSGVFENCKSLASIIIPNGVTSIGDYAFNNCKKLKSVTIPNSVTSIGDCAFSHSGIKSIVIPDSVTSIGFCVFSECHHLSNITTPSLPIPSDEEQDDEDVPRRPTWGIILPSIDEEDQASLSITITSGTTIPDSAFSNCLCVASITISDSVTSIGSYAFRACRNLQNITIPDSVTNIGFNAFASCENLVNIDIPPYINTIEAFAFSGCKGLTSVTIPPNVKNIKSYAFERCSSLAKVYISNNMTEIDDKAFYNSARVEILYLHGVTDTGSNIVEIVGKNSPNSSSKKSGCYVATCVYGSYDCPQVWTLRRFRDDTLGATWYGRLFIRAYYAISPTLVKWFGKTNWFKKLWRGKLDRMVAKLQSNGVEDTPYEDKNW